MRLLAIDTPDSIATILCAASEIPFDPMHQDSAAITVPGTGRPPRILIVEDDWLMSSESEAILNDARCDVIGIAVTADEAVQIAEAARPDLILMDIRLYGARDGIDAAIEIRTRFDIPCLYVTAHSDPMMRQRGERAAPAGWLTKPFSPVQLMAAVKAAIAPRS